MIYQLEYMVRQSGPQYGQWMPAAYFFPWGTEYEYTDKEGALEAKRRLKERYIGDRFRVVEKQVV